MDDPYSIAGVILGTVEIFANGVAVGSNLAFFNDGRVTGLALLLSAATIALLIYGALN